LEGVSAFLSRDGADRIELHGMDDVLCPRDKLEVFVGIHKILVDGLTFPSEEEGASEQSSSADLLLPVLIYRLFPLLEIYIDL